MPDYRKSLLGDTRETEFGDHIDALIAASPTLGREQLLVFRREDHSFTDLSQYGDQLAVHGQRSIGLSIGRQITKDDLRPDAFSCGLNVRLLSWRAFDVSEETPIAI